MDSSQTIAGIVLTLNEEQDLSRALRSLSWCDELLVVDSGSTDRTRQIANQCGARFVQHIQEPPFLITKQRNWALDHAGLTSDWALFLDADEEIGFSLSQAIQSRITSSSSFTAYELTPRYWFLGKWLKFTQGYPNWHPRLLLRSAVRFEGGVWESFSSNARVSRISIPYEHFAFSKGLDDWIGRHQRYSSWDAHEINRYLQSSELSTSRKVFLRKFVAHAWPIKPVLRFTQKYFFQLGFLEGWQGLLFCLLISFYDLMTVVKVIQERRLKQGLPL